MDDKWFAGALVFVCLVYIFGTYVFVEELYLFVQISLVAAIAITTSLIINIILYYRKKSKNFTVSYIFLAISMGSYAIAEILWGYFDSIDQETYPSLAEIFYVGYFVGAILFCVTVFWKRRSFIPLWIKITGITSGILCTVFYLLLSINYLDSQVFGISTFFIIQSSILLTTSLITVLFTLKSKHLKKIWIIFGSVFTVNSIADIFYYSGENAGHYLYTDWTNIVWFSTILLLFYGLYTHRYLYTKH